MTEIFEWFSKSFVGNVHVCVLILRVGVAGVRLRAAAAERDVY